MNTSKLKFDPRLWVALNHTILLTLGIFFFNFHRNWMEVFWTLGSALFSDVCLRYFFRKETLSLKNLLSPLVTGLSLVLLLNSYSIFVYIFSAITSIVSKYVLSLDKKHFFNPSLFGVAMTYFWFDFGVFSIQHDQFMGIGGYCAIQLCIVGFITLYFAKRTLLPIFYYSALITGVLIINFIYDKTNLLHLMGPELSASGILFSFFMMTDPVTSPSSWKKQALFSILCALISLTFTMNQIPNANFISLFILNSITMLFVWQKRISSTFR